MKPITKRILIVLAIVIFMRMLSSYLMKIGNSYYLLVDILIIVIFVPLLFGMWLGSKK